MEERIENHHSDPARLVKLKKRQLNASAIDSKTGKSYMEKFVDTPPERELACETSVTPALLTSDYTSESGIRILEISTVSPVERSPGNESASSSPNVHEVVLRPSLNGFKEELVGAEIVKVPDATVNDETIERSSPLHEVQVVKQLATSGQGKTRGGINGYESDDMISEADNYMDALASIESEIETDHVCRPNSNLRFLNAETHVEDSDANEEHLECRAQLSDTQSVGNFSTSDDGNNSFKKNSSSFSYSDTPSSVVENTPSDFDGAAKVFPSSEICGAEIVDKASNELSVTADSMGAKDDEFVVSHDICIAEESIPDLGDASSAALLNDLYPKPLQTDPGASLLTTDSLEGCQIGGTPAGSVTPDSNVPDSVENGTTMVDSIAVDSRVSSHRNESNDDIPKTSERYLVNELEDKDPNVISDSELHLSIISELASGKESKESSVTEVFQTLHKVEDSNRSSISGKIDLPSDSITEKQLCTSSLTELETFSANSLLTNNFTIYSDHSDVDDAVKATGLNSEDLPPTVDNAKSHISEEVPSSDSPHTPGLKEPQLDLGENISCLEHDSAEAGVPHSKERPNVEEISGLEKIGQFFSLEHPSSYPSDTCDDDLTNLDSAVHQAIEVEDAAVHSGSPDVATVADNMSNSTCLPSDTECPPSRNPSNLQESLHGFVVSQQQEVALDGVSTEGAIESGIPEEVHHGESASSDFSSKIAAADDDLSPAEKTQYSVSAIDTTSASTSLDLSNHESELRPSCDSYHVDKRKDTVSLPTFYLLEAEAPPEKSVKLQADQAGMEDLPVDEADPHPETHLDKSLKLQADQVGAECVVTEEAGSLPEIPLEKSEIRGDQLDMEYLQVERASENSSSLPSEQMKSLNPMVEVRSEQIDSPKCINKEICVDAYLESCQEDLPSQSSTSEFSSKLVGPEVATIEQASNPSESAPSSILLLPEAAQVDLGEMPPLPPLPPMQWRMGKFSQGLFPSIQPYRADEKVQFDFPASQSGMQSPQHPFLPHLLVENEKSLHVAEPLAGNLAQPHIYSMQLPTMVNDANSQYNYLALGGTQSLNPFLTLPAVSIERHGHSNLALEGEIVQSGSNFFSQTPTTHSTTGQNHDVSQEVSQPINQLVPETGVGTMKREQSLQFSKGEQGNPFVTSMPPPTIADEQVRLGLLMPEGERAWSSNNSAMMLDSEVEKPNGNPVNKLPRPRNPLIDAVNAHGKSKVMTIFSFFIQNIHFLRFDPCCILDL